MKSLLMDYLHATQLLMTGMFLVGAQRARNKLSDLMESLCKEAKSQTEVALKMSSLLNESVMGLRKFS